MDKLYIGDIPKEYCFARFSNNYIDLYKNEQLTGNQDFYRLYLYDNQFMYEHLNNTYSLVNPTIATYVEVTDDYKYRRDMPSIMFMSVVEVCILVILFNIVTSVFKKGGLFHGLL